MVKRKTLKGPENGKGEDLYTHGNTYDTGSYQSCSRD